MDGEEEEEQQPICALQCRLVTIASALESIPSVYRPFHSPLPVTSLASVPLIPPDI